MFTYSQCSEASGGGEQPEEGAQRQKRRLLSAQDQESYCEEHFFLRSERYSLSAQREAGTAAGLKVKWNVLGVYR